MSCAESPPPGFGAAAVAGQRPLGGGSGGSLSPDLSSPARLPRFSPRLQPHGTKSATPTSTMVNRKIETDDGNLEVLQQSQMQNEAMDSQSSCPTKSSLSGARNASPTKGPNKRSRVDATEVASPGVNASNTEQHLRPCKKSKGSKKHGKLEDNEGATGLRRPPTPIYLFEDECVFCHSFRTTKKFHGKMVQYLKGRTMLIDDGNPTNAIYVHKKCLKWATGVHHDGDSYVNVETVISRASRKKCSRCTLPGAALRCYRHRCAQTYHVTCAMMIPECIWDTVNRHVWCPQHASDVLPRDEMSSPITEIDITSCIFQNKCLGKEDISVDCHMEDNQINPLVTSNSSSPEQVPGEYLDKQEMFVVCRREDQQVDRLNTLSYFFPQGQCSDKEGISANYLREEEQINQSRAPVDQWVLLGSVLSASEKDSLKEFVSLTSSILAEEWGKNVTHVIVGRSAADPSYEVLMAILSGKWVVTTGWIVDCLAEPIPGPKTSLAELIPVQEISYEVTSFDGPKKGRVGAVEGAPKLFSGLYFCLSAYMNPEHTGNIKNLIAAAEGQVLEGMSPHSLKANLEKNPAKVYFIYDGGPPRDYASTLFLDKEIEEVDEYALSGAQVISHCRLFDAIASYDTRILERSHHFTPDMYAKTAL